MKHSQSIVESPDGVFDKKIFFEGDRQRQLLAREAERRRKQMEKEAKATSVMEATKDLETRYNHAVTAIRNDQALIESFDAPDYTFPKSASHGQENQSLRNLRTLLTLWGEVGILTTMTVFTDAKIVKHLADAQPLFVGCPWTHVLKFFNALRKLGESDVDIIQRLMTGKEFQRLIKTRNVNVVAFPDIERRKSDSEPTDGEIKSHSSDSEEANEVTLAVLDEITGKSLHVVILSGDARELKKMMGETEVFVHLDEARKRVMGYCRRDEPAKEAG